MKLSAWQFKESKDKEASEFEKHDNYENKVVSLTETNQDELLDQNVKFYEEQHDLLEYWSDTIG